jgi:uncharacterized protein with beta-barrel porin domain
MKKTNLLSSLLKFSSISLLALNLQNAAYATNVAAGGLVDADGDTTAIVFTGDGTLQTTVDGAAHSFDLGVTTATTNTGTILVLGVTGAAPFRSTFTGDVGESAKLIKLITIGSSTAGGSALFSSNVFATNITSVAGDGAGEVSAIEFKGNVTAPIALTAGTTADPLPANTLTYSGTTTQTQTGAITVNTDGTAGDLTVSNTAGLVTFSAGIGTDALKLKSVTTNLNSQVLFTGAVAANTLTVTGSAFLGAAENQSEIVALGAASNLFTGRSISNGLIAFNEIAVTRPTITAGAKIHISPVITDGQTVVLFKNEGATTLANSALTVAEVNAALQNNALFTYAAAAVGANATGTTVVTATARSASATTAELGVNLNKGTAFKEAHAAALSNILNDDGAFENFEQTLQVVGFVNNRTAASDTTFANQVAPQTDVIAGSTVAAKAVTSGVQNVISTRLASLRSGDGYSTGVVTGSGMSANSGFIQAFGSKVEQKNKGNEFGYDADTAGFALGFDGKVSDGVVVGISYANSKTDVDGKGTGIAKNDIKTNSGSLYADYATKSGYIEGSLTYGKSDNKTSRLVEIDGANRTYTSNYDSEQYSLRLFGGVPQSIGVGAFFTPFAGATISQIKTDAYTEKSTTANDSLRLRVAQDTVDSQVGTIGIKYHQVIKDGKTTFTPEVKLALNQEFGDDTITSTNTYQGGGASFKNSTAIEKTSATAGVGLNISADNVSFNIGYEADVRDKYLGHSAQAKITAKF